MVKSDRYAYQPVLLSNHRQTIQVVSCFTLTRQKPLNYAWTFAPANRIASITALSRTRACWYEAPRFPAQFWYWLAAFSLAGISVTALVE